LTENQKLKKEGGPFSWKIIFPAVMVYTWYRWTTTQGDVVAGIPDPFRLELNVVNRLAVDVPALIVHTGVVKPSPKADAPWETHTINME
jgi:hypothetical protein